MVKRKLKRKIRNEEVAKTGRIPVGTQAHFGRLRNPSSALLRHLLRKTRAEITEGTCHPAWGAKQIEGLTRLLESKLNRLDKQI
jgi:hypothetical protein